MALFDLGGLFVNESIKSFKNIREESLSVEQLKARSGEGIEDISPVSGFGIFGSNEVGSFNLFHSRFIDSQISNEKEKINEYRNMARMPEISDVLEDAVNESTQADIDGKKMRLKIVDSELASNSNISKNLQNEFNELFENRINISKRIDDFFMSYYIDGRIYWENIIDTNAQDKGIINIKKLPSDTMDFTYNVLSQKINFYVQYLKDSNRIPTTIEEAKKIETLIPFYPEQITYIDYGMYGANKKDVIGYLEKVKSAYNQVKLLESAIVIYRLVRAPERLVFTIDVGSLPRERALKYVEKVKRDLQKKVTYDPQSGNLVDGPNILSLLENFFLPTSCIVPETKIDLLDGRSLEMSEVIKEFETGKKLWVYSVDQQSGKIIPGEVEWAGYTRKNADLVRVHLDNDEYIDCTPDHKFVLKDGSEVEAQNLKENDSLMPLYKKFEKLNPKKNTEYEKILYDIKNGKWEFTHRIVNKPKKGFATHHKDFNSKNNSPENLISLKIKEHIKLHSQMNKFRWETDEEYRNMMSEMKTRWWKDNEDYRQVLSEMKSLYFKLNPEAREKMAKLMSEKWTDEIFVAAAMKNLCLPKSEEVKKKLSESVKSYFQTEEGKEQIKKHKEAQKKYWSSIDLDEHKKKVSLGVKKAYIENGSEMIKKMKASSSLKITERMYDIFYNEFAKDNSLTCKELTEKLENNPEFMDLWYETNLHYADKINILSKHVIKKIIRKFTEFDTFTEFKANVKTNHKVVKVEILDFKKDTCCLTIKDPGKNHNFALSAGVFIKNSEGRGSRIESIGGNPSGFSELDDLYYFQRKLYRALKYPMSRVDSAQEKQNREILYQTSNSGEITRDEIKWGRFLKKHQDRFCDAFTELFLLHLEFKGLREEYGLTRNKISIEMTIPNNYISQMSQMEIDARWSNYSNSDHEEFSKYWRMKKYLMMTDEEILANAAGFSKDRELGFTPTDNY